MPSTWISCGEPITESNTASRVGVSAGRSDRWKNGPREVPPRMMTQGILVCMERSCKAFNYSVRLKRIALQPAIHRHYRSRDVARDGRRQQNRKCREFLRLAIAADRDFPCRLLGAEFGRVFTADLFAHDASRRDAVDGDAVRTDFAREAF